MSVDWFAIGFFLAARTIEAYRDAEDFSRGARSMTLWWHLMKVGQYAFLCLFGHSVISQGSWSTVSVSLLIGFVWFEVLLRLFRKLMGART